MVKAELSNYTKPIERVKMKLTEILNKTCVIGLSYLDGKEQLLKESMLAGKVIAADEQKGIQIALVNTGNNSSIHMNESSCEGGDKKNKEKHAVFTLPSSLSAWFIAPGGNYKNEKNEFLIENPDYLVTWDIKQMQEKKQDKVHQWWSWQPRTTSPEVG